MNAAPPEETIPEDFTDSTEESSRAKDVERAFQKAEPNPLDEVKALAEKETRRMRFWKFIVVVAILVTGGIVSAGVYKFLMKKRQDEFYNRFSLHTSTISDVWKIQTSTLMESLMDLSEEISAFSMISNSTFPFVTVPLFEVFAKHTRDHAGMENIAFLPLVSQDDREAWES